MFQVEHCDTNRPLVIISTFIFRTRHKTTTTFLALISHRRRWILALFLRWLLQWNYLSMRWWCISCLSTLLSQQTFTEMISPAIVSFFKWCFALFARQYVSDNVSHECANSSQIILRTQIISVALTRQPHLVHHRYESVSEIVCVLCHLAQIYDWQREHNGII